MASSHNFNSSKSDNTPEAMTSSSHSSSRSSIQYFSKNNDKSTKNDEADVPLTNESLPVLQLSDFGEEEAVHSLNESNSCISNCSHLTGPTKKGNTHTIVSSTPINRNLQKSCFTDESLATMISSNCLGLTNRKLLKPRKCKEMDALKPVIHNSLYAKILNHQYDHDVILQEWFDLYSKDSQKGLVSIFQLILHVSGYQEYKIPSHYEMNKNTILKLIQHFEQHPPEFQMDTGKYLAKGVSMWSKKSMSSITDFIISLINNAHNNAVLYNELFRTQIFAFLSLWSGSCNKAMRHTGGFFVIKLYIVILRIDYDLEGDQKKYASLVDATSAQLLSETIRKRSCINEILNLLKISMQNNCLIGDNTLDSMRSVYAEEILKWVSLCPTLTSEILPILKRLLEDGSSMVRLSAIKTTKALFQNMDYYKYFELNPTFIKKMYKRLLDVENQIRIEAVKICTIILYSSPDMLNVKVRCTITLFLLCNSCKLATTAANFFLKCISLNSDESRTTTFDVLLRIAEYIKNTGKQEYVPLVVEALIDVCSELRDVKSIIDVLLTEELSLIQRSILCHLLNQSIVQTITAQCQLVRLEPRKKLPTLEEINTICTLLFENITELLEIHWRDEKCTQRILETLLVIPYDDVNISRYAKKIDDLFQMLQGFFSYFQSKEILELVSRTLAYICCKKFKLYNICKNKLENMQKKIVNLVVQSFTAGPKNTFEENVLRMYIMFLHHDLTNVISRDFLFNELLKSDENDANIMKYIITSGYQYLVYKLKCLIEEKSQFNSWIDSHESIDELYSVCDLFLKKCFKLLFRPTSELVYRTAFEAICDLYIAFRSKLRNLIEYSKNLEKLFLPSIKGNLLNTFMTAAQKLLFISQNENRLNQRREGVMKLLNMYLLSGIEGLQSCKIYCYYEKFYNDYGDCFDNVLNKLNQTNRSVVIHLIRNCLIYKYITGLTFVNNSSQMKQHLLNCDNLTIQFYKYISKYRQSAKAIFFSCITFAVSSKDYYPFLYVLRHFEVPLMKNTKKTILNLVINNVADKDNVYIISFINTLNSRRNETEKSTIFESGSLNISTELSEKSINESLVIDESD